MNKIKMGGQNAAWINRRQFLRRTTADVAVFQILPGSLLRGAKRLSANDKLNVAPAYRKGWSL